MGDAQQLWPATPLIDRYLNAAAIRHTGHRMVDLAVLYSILQNYANRNDVVMGGRPFRVHFFLIGYSGFGKSRSLGFGFNSFLPAYFASVNQQSDDRFMDLSGQNTAAGLSDAFNSVSDRYGRQIVTTWVEETVHLFPPNGIGKFQADITSFFESVLLGKANIRRVREKNTSLTRDRVEQPIINACFPATPQQYAELMKSSSSDMLRSFLLVSPNEQDRSDYDRKAADDQLMVGPNVTLLNSALETFSQWLNMLDLHQTSPSAPLRIKLSEGALSFFKSKFQEQSKAHEVKRTFFEKKKNHILMIAGLNALARFSQQVNEEDALCAWNFGYQSWRHVSRLDQTEEDVSPLTPSQRHRASLIKRIRKVVECSWRDGIGRYEICRSVHAINCGYSQSERDELFAYIDQEIDDIFHIQVDMERKNGRAVTKTLYFSKATWSCEQAATELPVAKPVWSSSASSFRDAAGQMHEELRDCLGYKPEWDDEVPKGNG